MRYDDVLAEIGQCGPSQKKAVALLNLPVIVVSLVVMCSVFTLTEPDHRCSVPGLNNDSYGIKDQFHLQLVNAATKPQDKCNVVKSFNIIEGIHFTNSSDANNGTGHSSFIGDNNNNEDEMEACNKWVYDESQFSSSIVTEFNLVCDRTYMRASSNMGMFAGGFVGCVVFGVLADVIGRKRSLQLCLILNGVCSILLYFMPSAIAVIIVRCIQGLSFQMFAIATTAGIELVGSDSRTSVGMAFEFSWLSGQTLVLPLAYLADGWRLVYLVIGALTIVFFVLLSYTPESPRWLIGQGKLEEAEEIMREFAASNKKTFPTGALSKDSADEGPQLEVWELFKHKKLIIRTFLILFNWFAVNTLYYGLSLNLDNFPGNIYVKYFIGCVAEGAGYLLAYLLLDRLGRRTLHSIVMFAGGLSCLMTIVVYLFLSSDYSWVITALAMFGKMAGSCAYATLYIMTTEIYPTVLRNSGLALCSVAENVSAMIAPYVTDLGKLSHGPLADILPMIVFGSMSIVASALSTGIPETLGQELPETVRDALEYDDKIRKSKNIQDKPEEKYRQTSQF